MNPEKRKELLHLGLGVATIAFSAVIGVYLAVCATGLIAKLQSVVRSYL